MRLIDIYRARYDGNPELALKSVAERLEELQKAQSPQWEEMWVSLMCIRGDCYLDLERFVEAENCFNDVYEKFQNPVGLLNRAYSRWAQGRLEEARADYIQDVSLPGATKVNKELAFRQLAIISMDLRDLGEAEAFLHCARELVGDTDEIREVDRDIQIAKTGIRS